MSKGTTGIVTRSYKSGSIIYFEGDRSEYIYVLKSGRVILTSVKLDTGEEVKEDVKQGEFFGVKSALGKYPREETAQTIGDTVVLIMPLAEFEKIVLRNVNVVRKMLRVFSNQLRRIHRMVRSVLGEHSVLKPDVELFRIGEYYNSVGSYLHADYVYKKYLECYPDGEYAAQAREKLEGGPGTGSSSSLNDFDKQQDSMDDFGFDEPVDSDTLKDDSGSEPAFDFDQPSSSSSASPLSNEMDDFIADDPFAEKDKSPEDRFNDLEHIKEMNDNGIELMDYGKPEDALALFTKIMEQGEIKNRNDQELFEAAHLNAAKCYLELSKNKEAFGMLAKLVREHPESESYKESLYYLGLIFEKAGQKDKAVNYYNKALNIKPGDQININAMNKIKKIQSAGK